MISDLEAAWTAFVPQGTSCIVGRFSPQECLPSRLKKVETLLIQIYFFFYKKYFCIELHSGERLRWFQCAEGPACLTMKQVKRSQILLVWNDSTRKFSTGVIIVYLYRFMEIKSKKKEALSIYSTLETSGLSTGILYYIKVTQ